MFYNYTNKDFTCNWGGIPYCFKAGEVYEGVMISTDNLASVLLNDVVSRVFAKHLADKVLNTPELNVNFRTTSDGKIVGTATDQMMRVNFTTTEMLINRALSVPDVNVEIPSFSSELPLMAKSEDVEEPEAAPEDEKAAEVSEASAPKKRGRKPNAAKTAEPESEFAL